MEDSNLNFVITYISEESIILEIQEKLFIHGTSTSHGITYQTCGYQLNSKDVLQCEQAWIKGGRSWSQKIYNNAGEHDARWAEPKSKYVQSSSKSC